MWTQKDKAATGGQSRDSRHTEKGDRGGKNDRGNKASEKYSPSRHTDTDSEDSNESGDDSHDDGTDSEVFIGFLINTQFFYTNLIFFKF